MTIQLNSTTKIKIYRKLVPANSPSIFNSFFNPMLKPQSLKYLGFGFFFLLNFCLKITHLADYPLAIDEPLSTYFPLLNLGDLLHYFTTTQTAPLYDILMHFYLKFTGIENLFLLRLPSLIFSSMAAGLLFLTGLRFFSREIGIGAACLFVISNIQVHFAQENRPYALFTLLSLLSVYYFLVHVTSDTTDRKIKSIDFVSLVLLHSALIYTHYFGIFVLFVELFACVVLKQIAKEKLKFWFFVGVGTGIIFLPNLYNLLRLFYGTAVLGRWWLKAPDTPEKVWYVLRQYTNSNWGTVASLSLLAGGYILMASRRLRPAISEQILLLFFPVAWIGMLLISYITPIFLDRYTLYITPAFYLLVLINLSRIVTYGYVRYGLTAILIGLFSYHTVTYFDRNWNVPMVIQKVNELKTPGTAVFICPSWFNLNYLYYTDQELLTKKILPKEMAVELAKRSNTHSIHTREMIDENVVRNADQILIVDFNSNNGLPNNGMIEKLRSLKPGTEEKFVFDAIVVYRLR